MTTAFREANPAEAWRLAQKLLQLSSDLVHETGKLRFALNFGTERCRTCSGLQAGPGVIATCYQVQACFYTHVREDSMPAKMVRLMDLLGKKD